ncbi:micrococcal nuclease [Malassezia cuniculi]|uniref:Micrococcal nuclease n=1 Tax=Malassezia cuniculi TaxID=948313 RepID=A0AAF0J7B7_9BASI|nr:micrococcal nuclease [Malassezia cuniculi]
MDTHAPEPWFGELARWVRLNAAALAGDGGSSGSGISSSGSDGARATPLTIDLHHLYYLLLRCEGLGLPTGPLDEHVAAHQTKVSRFVPAAADNGLPKSSALDDVRSIFSFQSASSRFWSSEPDDPDAPFRQLYAAIQRAVSLELGAPTLSRVAGAEDMPGDCATPLNAFRALTHLSTCAVDPAEIIGWDRLCIQLQALSCTYMQLADITDLFVGLVRRDWAGSRPGHELPAAAWHALRYVSLAHNELTFVPDSALLPLHSLTYLDLSSNLLNAVPPALAELPALQVLSVADNMIDSVLGIYTIIPNVRRLSVRGNRLESLCGIERLGKLQQVDLRDNRIADVGEIGRLAQIAAIASVWVTPNPVSQERNMRATCLALFAPEHPEIELDGRKASWLERRCLPQTAAPVATEAHVTSTVRRVAHSSDPSPEKRQKAPLDQRKARTSAPLSPTRSAEQLKERMERLRGTQGDDWLRQYARDALRTTSNSNSTATAPAPAAATATATATAAAPSYNVHDPAEDESGYSLLISMLTHPIGAAVASAAAVTGGYAFWWRYFRRIPNTAHITPAVLRYRRHLVGRVTSVGDADGFRFYHTPGIPLLRDWLHRPPTKASELRSQTISVRLAGADAPESGHFGREAQPFAKEAKDELKRLVDGQVVWLDVAHLDQYQRLVASVYVFKKPYIFGRTDVAWTLVDKGLATVA